jgi:hypothetical protein
MTGRERRWINPNKGLVKIFERRLRRTRRTSRRSATVLVSLKRSRSPLIEPRKMEHLPYGFLTSLVLPL